MDPITIGAAVITGVVAPLSKQILQRAADPERVARATNWVFTAVDHFLKVRRGEAEKEKAVPPPPESEDPASQPAEVDEATVAEKKEAVTAVAKTMGEAAETDSGLSPVGLDAFALEQLTQDIESLLRQLDTYLGTLRFEEEKAAQFGGLALAPPIVMNTIRIQQAEIVKRVQRLNKAMEQAYGVRATELDVLDAVAQD